MPDNPAVSTVLAKAAAAHAAQQKVRDAAIALATDIKASTEQTAPAASGR